MAKSNLSGGTPRRVPWLLSLVFFIVVAVLALHVSAGTYTYRLTVSVDDLRFSAHEGYSHVALHGARWLCRPGEPRLPLVPVRIALPAGCDIVGLAITQADSLMLDGDFLVWPSQPPQTLPWDDPIEFIGPLEDIYESNAVYPERAAELVGWGKLGGATVCEILAFPLRYIPLERKLILYTTMVMEIHYQWQVPLGGGEADALDSELIESIVSDAGELRDVRQRMMHDASPIPLGGDPIAYLIITRDSLRGYFEPLSVWKTRKGLPARIISTEQITFSYPGSDLQEKVRNCIKDFHANSGTDWVLLGGDTQIVPDRKAHVPLSDRPYLPCDLYYSDLDGTWNEDGDLYWGEVPSDNVDMYADVYVGRAPVSNGSEAETFVEKVLTYEGRYEAQRGHELDMLFLGEILWGDPGNPLDPDYTDAGIAKNMIDAWYVPAHYSIEKLYESQGSLSYGSVMAALNQGKNLINILCHGQYTSISLGVDYVTNSDFESVVNGPRYGLMYAVTCFSGGFDQNDCIGEMWVLSENGGGFFIGNSRYGYNSPGFPGEGPSDYYDQSFFESIFVTGFTNLGKAHADAKHEYVAESRADTYMRYVMYGLNLLGDPEMRLWTDTPAALDVTCASQIGPGPQTYSVNVSSGGSPVGEATVCLYKPDEVYCVNQTDGAGNVDAFMDPGDPGIVYVTVTKADFLPFIGQATVTDGSPPAAPQDVTAREEAGPSVDLRWSPVTCGDLHHYNIYKNTTLSPESLASVPAEDTTYHDTDVIEGNTYYYWVTSVDSSGSESDFPDPCQLLVEGVTSVPVTGVEGDPGIPVKPNPFSSSVVFVFRGDPRLEARIDVYDVSGRWVAHVRPQRIEDDTWQGHWDGKDASGNKLPPGIYLVRFSTDTQTSTHKVILLN